MPKRYTHFDVLGPFTIPVERLKRTNYITTGCPEFWRRHGNTKGKKGCYLFAFKAGKGYTPIYVGKATKSFEQECFEPHKTSDHYNRALADRYKGTPVMFFLAAEERRGRTNKKSIDDLETELIRWARDKNSKLSNKSKGFYSWGINGVEVTCLDFLYQP